MTEVGEIEDLFYRLDNIIRTSPELIRKLNPRWRALQKTATNVARVQKLQKIWSDIPQSTVMELGTQQSAPFVQLLLGITERKYKTNLVSLLLWWRRLVATGQENIITYFSWKRLEETTLSGKLILGSDILRVCTDNQKLLDNITAALSDDKCVDFKIRELLGGLSMQADVHKAWKTWVLRNHPDKGGDAETFLKVKLVYDEWNEINKQQLKQE